MKFRRLGRGAAKQARDPLAHLAAGALAEVEGDGLRPNGEVAFETNSLAWLRPGWLREDGDRGAGEKSA
jgi:hypothetical protein